MERCTKANVNWKDMIISEKDFFLIKLPHPIEWMLKNNYYNPDKVLPTDIVNDYNNLTGSTQSYIKLYNNWVLPGFCVVCASIKSWDYPAGFSLGVRGSFQPRDSMHDSFVRFYKEDLTDNYIEIIEKIKMYDSEWMIDDNTFDKFCNWHRDLIPDNEEDKSCWTVYDRARKKYWFHPVPDKGELTIDYVYDYMKQKKQEEMDATALEILKEWREMLNELTNDEVIPDEADIAEARLAQIDLMHEVAAEENTEAIADAIAEEEIRNAEYEMQQQAMAEAEDAARHREED